MPARRYRIGVIRFTKAPRAVADSARSLTRFDDVRHVVCDAVQRRVCTVAELTAELAAGPAAGPRCSAMRWPKSATASGRWPRPTAGS